MSFLSRLFRRSQVALDEAAARRLAAWHALPETGRHERDAVTGRFVVVDGETTGLNLAKDRLISIAAIAMTGRQINLGETYESILRQAAASRKENILVHGISGTEQTEEDLQRLMADRIGRVHGIGAGIRRKHGVLKEICGTPQEQRINWVEG